MKEVKRTEDSIAMIYITDSPQHMTIQSVIVQSYNGVE